MRGITSKIWEKFGIFLVFLEKRVGIFGTRFSKVWYFLKIWTWSPCITLSKLSLKFIMLNLTLVYDIFPSIPRP